MAGLCRLRQICLVAPAIEPVVGDIAAIMGLKVCYRDGNVAKYGLENALLPVDTILLEVVAPFQPGTAAGRFIEKTGGRGGYMAIFCCDDPDARGAQRQCDGRAHRQRDRRTRPITACNCTRAIAAPPSSNSTTPPAATIFWDRIRRRARTGTKSIRKDVTQALTEVEMESPEPEVLAAHWGKIIGIPVSTGKIGDPELKLPNASFRFVKGAADIMSGLTFRVADIAKVRDAAKARGYAVSGDSFELGGVTFRLVA